jgi:epoxide hydrolase
MPDPATLVDSPAGLCAWIVEEFWSWMDCDGDPANVFSRDEMLDNLMLYWLPATGASSARMYWESFTKPLLGPVAVPVGCSIIPKEIIRCSQRWAERSFADLRYWNEPTRSGRLPGRKSHIRCVAGAGAPLTSFAGMW